jgi:hypothetical protein
MSLGDSITLGPRASGVYSGIITIHAIGETREFGDMHGFYHLEPCMQVASLALFEQSHTFLAQQIGRMEVRTGLTDVLKLLSLLGGEFLR